MAEKQKIEIEIESKLLEQLKVFSVYMNCTIESLIGKILKKEIRYYTCDNFQHLNEFPNDILFFDNLINEFLKIGD
ncbi:hypothetical protein ES702_02606 [subsurface metagenome]